MQVEDFDGSYRVNSAAELRARLDARRGEFGAFVLSHTDDGPSLWIHVNKGLAYLHFFPDAAGGHPGFQSSPTQRVASTDMQFLQTDGTEADSFTASPSEIVSFAVARTAAEEFMQTKALPQSVEWAEL